MFNNDDSPNVFWRPKLGYYSNQSKNAKLYVEDGKDGKPDKRKPTHATSYNWWVFFKYINGKAVFNDGYYSQQTSSHQAGVKAVLKKLRIKFITIESRYHLNQLDECLQDLYRQKFRLEIESNRKNSSPKRNAERERAMKDLDKKIKELASIGVKISKKSIEDMRQREQALERMRIESMRKDREAQKIIRQQKRELLENSWNTEETEVA
jgi:hypothetical protein